MNGLAGRVSARPQAWPPVHELPGNALLKLEVDAPGRAGGWRFSTRWGGFCGDPEQTSRPKADARQPRAPGRLSALTPLLPSSSARRSPILVGGDPPWSCAPRAGSVFRKLLPCAACLPADVSVQPRERELQTLRSLRGVWGARVTRWTRRLAPGLPSRQSDHVGAALPIASSATKRCARRSRGPAEGCVSRSWRTCARVGSQAGQGLPSGGGGCCPLPHRCSHRGAQGRAWAACPHCPPTRPGCSLEAFLPPGRLDDVTMPGSLRGPCTVHPEVQPPREPGEDRVPRLEQGRGGVTPETPGPAAAARSSPLHPCSAQSGRRLWEPPGPFVPGALKAC